MMSVVDDNEFEMRLVAAGKASLPRIEKLKIYVKEKLTDIFTELGETLSLGEWQDLVDEEEFVCVNLEVHFEYHNCKKQHVLYFAWGDTDGYGMAVGQDQDEIIEIESASVYRQLYFDLAVEDLAEEFWE